jgi:acetate kinase
MRVLVLNAGSSTLKASLVIDGVATAHATVEWPAGEKDASSVVTAAVERLPPGADAVGYRVVHGGSDYQAATPVDHRLLERVEALDALAPLHNKRAASVMRAGLAAVPGVPHIACFDTAFHAGLPEEAWRYPVPNEWVSRYGIRRFGFHGISVAWSVRRAAEMLERPVEDLRLVVAHLGSGCSVTAVEGGASVHTSMGFTPYEGLMMSTRSGSIDPGILLHLLNAGMTPDALADAIAHESGLRGVAGAGDLREIEARADEGDARARLAMAMFTRRAASGIAAAMTALADVDALVLTGGIGEHSTTMRAEITRRLSAVHVPVAAESVACDGIAAAGPPAVLVVEAREDLVIASQVATLASA